MQQEKTTLVRILASGETATHLFNVTEDGILAIGIDPALLESGREIPEYIERTAHRKAFIALDEENCQVLYQMLDARMKAS